MPARQQDKDLAKEGFKQLYQYTRTMAHIDYGTQKNKHFSHTSLPPSLSSSPGILNPQP